MKILQLRFKNLNSLYGEWLIDFSSDDYLSNGIFALTGPTGSGKSTILDAICLALYGATPRLGKITKNTNEIMSRHTGECFAEVTFEASSGVFKCHWSQHRARKKAHGNLAETKHEISQALTGEILESKKKQVAIVIEQKTGMDFDRFTRSILLAQGGFDTFLKADIEQKSKVLEQITGTEIYSQISMRVHERQKNEGLELTRLQAEISAVNLLTDEQEHDLSKQLTEQLQVEHELSNKFKHTEKAIDWLNIIAVLDKEIIYFIELEAQLELDFKNFSSDRIKLEQALKAAEFDAQYATLETLRQQLATEKNALKEQQIQLPELENLLVKSKKCFINAEQKITTLKQEQLKQSPLFHKVKILDQQIIDRTEFLVSSENDYQKVSEKISVATLKKQQLQKQLDRANSDLALIEDYLISNASDELLITQLAGIELQINTMQQVQSDGVEKLTLIKQQEKQQQQLTQRLSKHNQALLNAQQQLKTIQSQIEEQNNSLTELLDGRLLREYRTEKDTIIREMLLLKKIAELTPERNKLEDNKACPLCGSKEHPYARENIPVMDETEVKLAQLTERIHKAEQLEQAIKELSSQEKVATEQLQSIEKKLTKVSHEQQTAELALADARLKLTDNKQQSEQLKQVLLEILRPLGIDDIVPSSTDVLLISLKERLTQWQQKQKQTTELQLLTVELMNENKNQQALIESQTQLLKDNNSTLEKLKDEINHLELERQHLFANKDPDKEQERLNNLLAEAESVEKKARIDWSDCQQKLNSTQVRLHSHEEQIKLQSTQLDQVSSDFINNLEPAGFINETDYIKNCLNKHDRELLIIQSKQLDDQKNNLHINKADRQKRLLEQKEKKITTESLDNLVQIQQQLDESLNNTINTVAALRHQQSEHNKAKINLQTKQNLLEAQKTECLKWDRLHGLIGSADGKKYRNFAQGLTFELMVSHANRQLAKMTDRYLLIRDAQQPLELNVIDNYQAGEIRSTKNLSGGESFIVSLTLALGLSKMASDKVKVDSLFLDEGFGTLDEEALDTALETLSGLQQEGKLIGIISHVSALKERISTQISIQPVSGGRSTVSGPGCSFNSV